MVKESNGTRQIGEAQNVHLQKTIAESLCSSGHPSLRRIEVVVENDCVVLSGTVTSFYMKQIVQETARQACPSRRVYNDVDVLSAGD